MTEDVMTGLMVCILCFMGGYGTARLVQEVKECRQLWLRIQEIKAEERRKDCPHLRVIR